MTPRPDFIARLAALSETLSNHCVDAYLQPMADAFQGEYIPAFAARLPYLTGFTGSAGMGLFFAQPDHARPHTLFTDGRYTLQAQQELAGTGVVPVNSVEVTLAQYLTTLGAPAIRIGYDAWLVTHAQLNAWQQALPQATFVAMPNPVDAIWADRPAAPAGDVTLHPESLSGATYAQKRDAVLGAVRHKQCDGVLLTLPDGINWLLNMRGSDIPFNPLLLGYLQLSLAGEAVLFTYERALPAPVATYLAEQRVSHRSIEAMDASIFAAGSRWLIDPTVSAQAWWELAAQAGATLVSGDDPTLLPKACKNAVELDGIRAAHVRDGAALSRFLCWFDHQVGAGRFPTELQVVDALEQIRARDNRYRGASFATIAGSGAHGAIVHYRATAESDRRVQKGELFLLDSGGQYEDGTTDVTRTVTVGVPTSAMKAHNTRVLKGHIALAMARFPEGTSGAQLDVLARQYLWEAGLDYAHGTGHGVGAFLCVHEGPQRIATKGSAVALQPGMILSNEPGYYATGQYGIRIENLVAVVQLGQTEHGKKLLGFETLTLAPIDTRLVEVSMLSVTERNWLNAYHQRVYKTHVDAMGGKERDWLAAATRAI
ncbi:MAG: X-Pro aminopeptidase [Azospirillum brasilense]|nr:MAG: X-Pro aminopeptidase [Azospirillum brasilense]